MNVKILRHNGSDILLSNLKGPRVFLYEIHEDLYKPPTSIEIIFHLDYNMQLIFSKSYQKEEVIIKSYATLVIRYVCGMYESRSFI